MGISRLPLVGKVPLEWNPLLSALGALFSLPLPTLSSATSLCLLVPSLLSLIRLVGGDPMGRTRTAFGVMLRPVGVAEGNGAGDATCSRLFEGEEFGSFRPGELFFGGDDDPDKIDDDDDDVICVVAMILGNGENTCIPPTGILRLVGVF